MPRIGGQLQAAGFAYAGQLHGIQTTAEHTSASVDFARAYPVAGLSRLLRRLELTTTGEQAGTIRLHDTIAFAADDADGPCDVEEAFITWLVVVVDGGSVLIAGRRHTLRLVIEAPEAAEWTLGELREQSEANAKPAVLKRLSFVVPAAVSSTARVRMELLPAQARA